MHRTLGLLLLVAFLSLSECALHAGKLRADAPEDPFQQVAAALARGDTKKALELANQAVEADKKEPRAYTVRGMVYDVLKRRADAVADFTKAIDLDPKLAQAYQLRGGTQFKRGLIAESLADFDKYLELRPEARPGHWQRGISLYYAGKYDEGRKQFASYEKVDTNDVENAVWHFLCVARLSGIDKARASMLKVGKDRRVPLTQVYALFQGDLKPADVLAAAEKADLNPAQRKQALFYAHLYLGLYYDCLDDRKQAMEHLELATDKYPNDQYMGDVARVHLERLRKMNDSGKK